LAQNVYEALFLFDSNQFARDRSALPKAVEEMITKGGGEVLVSRLWEERKLAYPIGGHRKGAYWLIYFRNDGQVIGPLNRQCGIHDGILRQLVTKIHPRLVETIIAHAEGRQATEAPAAESAPEKPAREIPRFEVPAEAAAVGV
jgi:small subunit ribosomal protein S6